MNRHHLLCSLPALAFALAALPGARAADLTWDPAISGGASPGGSGNWTNTTPLSFYNGSANVGWTDTAGVDIAVFNGPAGTVTIPTGETIVGNGMRFVTSGWTVTGDGGFNFRNNTSSATAPATLTVPAGITASFSAANNQNNTALPPISVLGGGTLEWAGRSTGTRFTINGGTTVNLGGTGEVVGVGTTTLTNGLLRLPAGTHDAIADGAAFTGGAQGTMDLNGKSEAIATISGSFRIRNDGAQAAVLTLSGTGTPTTYTGIISDGNSQTSLRLDGSTASGQADNTLVQPIAGTMTYTGPTVIARGTLRLDFNHAASPTDNILAPGGSLVIGSNPIGGPGTGARAVLEMAGKSGTANSQSFASTTFEPYSAAGLAYTVSSSSTGTLNLGPITRGVASHVNISATAFTVNTPTGTADTVLMDGGVPWLTVGGVDWGAKDATNTRIIPLPAASYTAATPSSLAGHANMVSGVDVRLDADAAISSLRFNTNDRRTVNLGGNKLTAGGILVTSAVTFAGVSVGGGTVTSPGAEVLFVHTAAGNYRFSGMCAKVVDGTGPVGFTKSGNCGTFLTADNSFTGPLVVNQGTLVVTGANAPSGVLVNGNSTNASPGALPASNPSITMLQLGNGGTQGSIGSAPITIGGLGSFAIKRSDTVVLDNVITGSGSLHQAWSGTTVLRAPSASYAWRGDTAASAGVLELDYTVNDTSRVPDLSVLRLGGGTLRLKGGSHLEITNGLRINAGASVIERTDGGTGRIRLNAITGLGTATTAGNAGATIDFSAPGVADTDTVNVAGILGAAARATVAGSDWASSASTATTDNTEITAYTGYTPLDTTPGTDTANSIVTATATALTGSRTTNSLKISGSGADQTIAISGTLSLTSGGLLVTGPNAVNVSGGSLTSLTAGNPDLIIHHYGAQPLTIASAIVGGRQTGQTNLTVSGTGTVVLEGANTYAGTTFINGTTVSAGSNANLSGNSGTIDVVTAATNSPTVTLASATLPAGFSPGCRMLGQTVNSISGTTVTLGGNASTAISTTSSVAWVAAGNITLNRGTLRATGTYSLTSTATGAAGGTQTLTRGIALNGVGGTIEVTGGNTLTFAGVVSGPGGLTKTGTGTLLLTNGGNVTHTGPEIVREGTLRAGAANAFGFNCDVTVEAAGTLDLGGFSSNIGSLSGNGTVTNSTGTGTLTVGLNFKDTEFSGLIQNGAGTVALAKASCSNFTLSGANTFSGAVTVDAGTLTANNTAGSATGTGLVTVRRVATLAGTGSIGGNVTSAGTIAPGDAKAGDTTDDLAFAGNLTCTSGSIFQMEISGTAAGAYDQIKVSGALTIPADQVVNVVLRGYTPAAGDTFNLVDWGSLTSTDVLLNVPPLPPGLEWDTANFRTDGTIAVRSTGSPYTAWLATHFTPAELADPLISGPQADPDLDGLANLIEFAVARLPRDASSGGVVMLPTASVVEVAGQNHLLLTFTVDTARLAALDITGRCGTDLTTWPDTMDALAPVVNGDGTTTLRFRSPSPIATALQNFCRIVISVRP